MSQTLYTCLVEEQTPSEAFIQTYWARAEHLGGALEKIREAAIRNGLTNPKLSETDPYEEIESLKAVSVSSGFQEGVFWADARHYFPPEPTFQMPYGIIPSCLEGDCSPDEIAAGYSCSKDEQGLITLGVNVEHSRLFDLYRKLLRQQTEYRVFWYLMHGHWDDEGDVFLVNESLNSAELIIEHLANNTYDSLQNGYVTVTAYLEEGATNLNISDHKRIVVTTFSQSMCDSFIGALEVEGYHEDADLVSIDRGIHHWHYRHPESLSKVDLLEKLRARGFRGWSPGN